MFFGKIYFAALLPVNASAAVLTISVLYIAALFLAYGFLFNRKTISCKTMKNLQSVFFKLTRQSPRSVQARALARCSLLHSLTLVNAAVAKVSCKHGLWLVARVNKKASAGRVHCITDCESLFTIIHFIQVNLCPIMPLFPVVFRTVS